jgi:hypothetical protein
MKKILLIFIVWLCLCSPAFANIPVENIYNNHLLKVVFLSDKNVNKTINDLQSMANKNYEINCLYCDYTVHDNSLIWKVNIEWKQSVKLLHDNKLFCSPNDYIVKKKAEEILNSIIAPNMSDYQKICKIYNWIQDNTDYDYKSVKKSRYRSYRADNMVGVFYDRKALCGGYADAFYYLTNLSGIDCKFVSNKTHCWNVVKLQDKWYFVDVTDEYKRCFLRGTNWGSKNNYITTYYLPVKVEKTDYKH